MPAANASQKPTAIPSSFRRPEDRDRAADDDREREPEPRRHRPPPEVERLGWFGAEHEEAEHEPEVRRIEDVAPRDLITCFDSSETAAVPA